MVTGNSMIPTLFSGDRILVSTISNIERFDTLVFNDPSANTVVKRVIGLPGEEIRYTNDQLFINDEPVDEPFLEDIESGILTSNYLYTQDEDSEEAATVPDGHYFLMGDNRRFSFDSRFYGSIDETNIIGEVKFVFYPFDRMQLK